MPDVDVRKAVAFVTAFLPGFLALALAESITDLRLTQFEFAYFGIALSVVIHLLVGGAIAGWRKAVGCVRKKEPTAPSGLGHGRTLALQLAVSIPFIFVSGLLVGKLAENDSVNTAMRWLSGTEILTLSHNDAFYYILKHRERCTLPQVSPREYVRVDNRELKPPGPHKPWVLVRGADSGLYEGNPRFFGSRDGEAQQIYLAPVCKVSGSDETRKYVPLDGNGVLIKDIVSLEFVDVRESECIMFYRKSRAAAIEGAKCPD